MKFTYIIFFLLILSCSTTKKNYVCGDHPCINKKEFNEYFSNNLIIEIESRNNPKDKSANLVLLNTNSLQEKKNTKAQNKKNKKIEAKERKERLKAEKNRLKEVRKIRKKEEKNNLQKLKIVKRNKKNEIQNNNKQVNKIVDKIIKVKKPSINEIKTVTSINSTKSESMKSICDEIKDCNIDKIAELLKKKGEDKPFPNISSN